MVVRFPGRPQSQFNLMFLNIKKSSLRKRESLCEMQACLYWIIRLQKDPRSTECGFLEVSLVPFEL